MKATINIPDELHRQVKAKSALEGRTLREVTEALYRAYVEGTAVGHGPGEPSDSPELPEGRSVPSWFGVLRRASRGKAPSDMESIRKSIASGIAAERDL